MPRVLVDVEPLCRSCKKLERKDCSAAVLSVVPVDDELEDTAALEDAAEDDEAALELPDVVPPKSAINFENAVFKSEMTVEDTVEGALFVADVFVTSSLLLRSLMRDVSAVVSLLCP